MKQYRKHLRLIIAIFMLLCASPALRLDAQDAASISGKLVYIKRLPSGADEVVILSSQGSQTFTIAQSQTNCYSVSPLGDYLALSTPVADSLVIRSLESGNEVARYRWADGWKPCEFGFSPNQIGNFNLDTTLIIDDRTNPSRGFYFDVLTGSVSTSLPAATVRMDEPPQLLSSGWILRSPDPNIVVYEHCLSGEGSIDIGGDVTCTSADEFDIYSFSEQRVIQTLTDISFQFLEQPEGLLRTTAWSPTGRYFAYLAFANPNLSTPALRIYDVVARRYLDTDASGGDTIDEFSGLFWSPDEHYLAFRLATETSSSEPLNLIMFATKTGTFQQYQGYTINPDTFNVFWSPDDQSFAFLQNDQTLTKVDLSAGSSTMLDTDVQTIVVWKAI